MKFKFAYGTATGISSGRQDTENQDAVRTVQENGVAVMTLAGSAKAAAEAAALLAGRFDKLYSSEADHIRKELRENAVSGILMFAAVKQNRYLTGQMGGGLIARLNGSCSVLSGPETEDAGDLRIYQGELQEPLGFLILSGGACQSLYDYSTGILSPACGTFFQWLKEYDEETVSDALADNINKYFVKETKGSISVALMVTDENDAEPEAVPIETDEDSVPAESDGAPEAGLPAAGGALNHERGKHGNRLLRYLVALLVVAAAVAVCFLIKPDGAEPKDIENGGKSEVKPPAAYSVNTEPSVTFSAENPQSYDAGEYKVGVDIPAGEYFFWTGEMLQPGSIVVNDDSCLSDELYCMTIRLNEWDTLVTDYRFTSAENVNPVEPADGILISGKYKIGKDIVPGTYTVRPASQSKAGRYYSILNEEISNDTEITGETTVTVPDEGYIVFYRAVFIIDKK